MKLFNLTDKVALITGGNGGIGFAMAKAIGEAGATVVIAGRNEDKNRKSIEELNSLNIKCKSLIVDVVDENSCNTLIEDVVQAYGKLNILINNAGTNIRKRPEEYELKEWISIIDTNLISTFTCSKAAFNHFKNINSGKIINIGSMMGTVGVENGNYEGTDFTPATSPLYFYEKGGMHNFTRWAASMLGPFNIRVNCLAPGGFKVPSHPDRFVKNYSKRTQLGRMANSTDLKGPIIFLASDSSAYLTGTIIAVDGGYTAK